MLEVLAYVPAPHQDILPKELSLAFPAQSRQVDPGWGWGEVDPVMGWGETTTLLPDC